MSETDSGGTGIGPEYNWPTVTPSDSLGTVQSAVSAGSSVLDFSVPWKPKQKTLYTGNCVVARVEGQKLVLSSQELQRLLNAGYDVEVLGHQQGF
jgi:hypothetical protein